MAATGLREAGRSLARRQWPIAAVLLVLLVLDVAATPTWPAGAVVLLLQMLVTSGLAVLSVLWPWRAALSAAVVMAVGTGLLWPLDSTGIGLHAAALTSVLVIVVEAIGSLPAREAVAASGLLGASAAVQFVLLGSTAALGLREMLTFGVALSLSTVLAGMFLRGRAADRARLTAAAVDTARESERLAMAREVHDVVAHHLTGIVVVAHAERWNNPDGVGREFLDRVIREGTDALEATRHLVQTLRVADDRPGGPVDAPTDLPAALRDAAARCAVPVEIATRLPQPLSDDVRCSVVRIVTEALTNVTKHAVGATGAAVRVDLADGADRVAVVVTDDGRDAPTGGSGYGLLGMSERAALHGGTLTAGRGPAGGWRVVATIPLAPGAGRR